MANDDYLEELIKLKEQTQAEEEQLEISRGVDIGDSYTPWDNGESYVTGLEARIAKLERKLNPRLWTQEESDAWHRAVLLHPATIYPAFEALLNTI